MASLSVASRHFPSIKELAYYFYIVFNCPNVETYCQLFSIPTISGFPLILRRKMSVNITPYNYTIRSQSKKPIHNYTNPPKPSTFVAQSLS